MEYGENTDELFKKEKKAFCPYYAITTGFIFFSSFNDTQVWISLNNHCTVLEDLYYSWEINTYSSHPRVIKSKQKKTNKQSKPYM